MRIAPIYRENYDVHWSGIDWRFKKVLDIGADVGSTADYFLSKGASVVYAVEGNPHLYLKLEEHATKIGGIVPIFMFIESPNQIEELIRTYKPDIVKMDCEGCEKHLIQVPEDILRCVPEYIIEAHSQHIFHCIVEKMVKNYDVWFFEYVNKLKIIIAKQISKYRICG